MEPDGTRASGDPRQMPLSRAKQIYDPQYFFFFYVKSYLSTIAIESIRRCNVDGPSCVGINGIKLFEMVGREICGQFAMR